MQYQISKFNVYRLIVVITLVGCFACKTNILASGIQNEVSFKHFVMPGKFSLTSVTSIAQDSLGFIWYGTRNGVFRYDGVEMMGVNAINTYLDSINFKDILVVHFDSKGYLWLGSNFGLVLYNPRTGFVETITKEKGRSFGAVSCIEETSLGKLLLGTSTGLYSYDRNIGKATLINFVDAEMPNDISHRKIVSLHQSQEGCLWVGTRIGLFKLKANNGKYEPGWVYSHQPENDESLRCDTINAINEDCFGNLWIGTDKGLDLLPKGKNVFRHVEIDESNLAESNVVRALTVDFEQRLWVGTKNGIAIIDTALNVRHVDQSSDLPNCLTDNKIRALFTDANGSIWVGTYFGGVNYWNKQNMVFSQLESGISTRYKQPIVNAIVQDANKNLYFGLENEGVSIFNYATNTYRYLLELAPGSSIGVVKTLLSEENKLWIGTFSNGLICYNVANGEYRQYVHDIHIPTSLSNNTVVSIAKYSDSLYWIGTSQGGLNLLNAKTGVFRSFPVDYNAPFSVVTSSPRALFVDSKNNVWIGGNGGLCVLQRDAFLDGSFKFIRIAPVNDKNLIVSAIHEDVMGHIWVGTINESLLKVVNHELLPVDIHAVSSVYSIVEDAFKSIWFTSNAGVVKYDLINDTCFVYNHLNDIEPNEFLENSGLIANNGNLYFGGASGVTVINLERLRDASGFISATKPVITNFLTYNASVNKKNAQKVLTKAVEYVNAVKLTHKQNMFTIRFVAPNYIKTVPITYQYRLLGFNSNWINTSENSVTYTLQKAGDYVFEVRVANGVDRVANITQFEIELLPPFLRSTWAILAYLVFVVLGLWLIIRILHSKTKLRHQLELEANERKNIEKANEQKLKFFTNVSHDFRTPLTLIIGALQNFIDEFDGGANKLRKLIAIQRNANSLLHLINELLDFRKMEKKQMNIRVSEADFVGFLKEIYLLFQPHAEAEKYKYQFVSSNEVIMAWFDKDKLERVFCNLLSNAFKFTPKGGTIQVNVYLDSSNITVEITDSGVGIPNEHIDKIFDRFYEVGNLKKTESVQGVGIGLTIAKSIVKLHKGRISVQSCVGEGSTFVVSIPLGCTHFSNADFLSQETSVVHRKYVPELKSQNFNFKADIDLNNVIENDTKTHTILIAEDNPEVALLIKECLSSMYNVIIEENGEKALERALLVHPDLIISDVMMPKMDGIEFCSKIKTNFETSHIPFVLLTARTSLMHRFDGLESGADEYISKPFYVKELVLKCNNLIATRKRMQMHIQNTIHIPGNLMSQSSIDEVLMKKVVHLIEENIANELFNVQDLCEQLSVGRTVFYTKIKALTGKTPNELLVNIRLKYAAGLLIQNKYNISEIAKMVGYQNANYFSRSFKSHYGVSPKDYEVGV